MVHFLLGDHFKCLQHGVLASVINCTHMVHFSVRSRSIRSCLRLALLGAHMEHVGSVEVSRGPQLYPHGAFFSLARPKSTHMLHLGPVQDSRGPKIYPRGAFFLCVYARSFKMFLRTHIAHLCLVLSSRGPELYPRAAFFSGAYPKGA